MSCVEQEKSGGGGFSWLSTCIRLDFFAQQYDKIENISQFYLVCCIINRGFAKIAVFMVQYLFRYIGQDT